ncbi:ABC transporter ATP-binding protein [Actinomadura hibisca]|uniref:ABC transporter ATP-binding protein n=1 Tax=Actinomadura hibisca TaxID=68565 RepID=UPI0008367F4E|nr:ABC transporter ATP-binding protein [Actinomadura hibisca]
MDAPPPKAPLSLPRLRLLWTFARPHRGMLAAGLVLALLGSALGLATPMVTKWVLDTLADRGSLAAPIVAMVVLFLVGAVVSLRQWVLLGAIGERVVLEARESLVRRMLRSTVPALTRRSTGELVTRVTSDTLLLREAAAGSLVGLVNGLVMLVGTLALMGVLDLVLLGATVLATAVVVVLFVALMPALAAAQVRAQDHVGRLGGVLEGALRAIRTVKVSGAEDRQAEAILADARAAAEHGVRSVRREALAWTVAWSGLQVAIIVILGLGAWRVGAGRMEVSALIAFLLYAFGLMEPIMQLSQSLTTLQSGIAAAERIREVDDLETEPVAVPGTGATGDAAGPVLELRGVTAGYGPDAAPAVRDIDLTVPRRGHIAIVGPSGAGKTTLMSLILRFLEPQEGELRLDGVPYRDRTHAQIRARLAYVEQDTPIVPGTVGANIRYARPDATDEQVARVLADVRLAGKIEALDEGLDTPLTSTSVSGGERQRIALARALLREPEVLLLDEATAQLDGLTEDAVQRCIRERAAAGAVVTIAHRLSTVIDADLIVVMEDGRIRAQGGHEELLASDRLYAELVEALRIAARPDRLDAAATPA